MTIKEIPVGLTESWFYFDGPPDSDGIKKFLEQKRIDTVTVTDINRFSLLAELLIKELKYENFDQDEFVRMSLELLNKERNSLGQSSSKRRFLYGICVDKKDREKPLGPAFAMMPSKR